MITKNNTFEITVNLTIELERSHNRVKTKINTFNSQPISHRTIKQNNNHCICILMAKLNNEWLYMLKDFTKYDIYLIIDDNTINYNEIYGNLYPAIHFIQIDNNECANHGYRNSNSTHVGFKQIIAWDKSFYYFSRINTNYDNVWFIEEDVFFYNEETILNIDKQYKTSDLLTQNYGRNEDGTDMEWVWSFLYGNMNLPPPYYCAMLCAMRMSKQMIKYIDDYVKQYKTLFFIEAMVPTIAKQNRLVYNTPPELFSILHRSDWNFEEINKTNLFHPIKDMKLHLIWKTLI
jgi:hypothetical protein